MAGRRGKPRVVWLPNTNANSIGQVPASTAQEFVIEPSGARGDFAVAEIPITIDSDQDPIGAADVSLADIFSSGYRLRRIVGKVFISCTQVAEDSPIILLVTAGFIIRRADNTGTSLALQAGNATNLSPGDIENSSDPWIWRRAWLVRNNLATTASLLYVNTPTNNMSPGYGSAVDGPHVDVKTGRIVSQEERLFLDVSAMIIVAGGDPQIATQVRCLTDVRALASMRTSIGNRRNASR